MRLLLDTHALLWWAHEPEKLSAAALEAISSATNDVFVSAVSAFEIATKDRRGRLSYRTPLSDQFLKSTSGFGFESLPVDCNHAERAGNLAGSHKDPWDRLIAAQAQIEGMKLVTVDRRIAEWNVHLFW